MCPAGPRAPRTSSPLSRPGIGSGSPPRPPPRQHLVADSGWRDLGRAALGRIGIEAPEPERGKQGPGDRPSSEARVLRGVLPGATPRALGGLPTGRTRSPPQRPEAEALARDSLGRARGPEWVGVVELGNRASPGSRSWGGTGFPFSGQAGTTVGPPGRTRECSLNKGKSPRHSGTAPIPAIVSA